MSPYIKDIKGSCRHTSSVDGVYTDIITVLDVVFDTNVAALTEGVNAEPAIALV